jgi:hypothetical protein
MPNPSVTVLPHTTIPVKYQASIVSRIRQKQFDTTNKTPQLRLKMWSFTDDLLSTYYQQQNQHKPVLHTCRILPS